MSETLWSHEGSEMQRPRRMIRKLRKKPQKKRKIGREAAQLSIKSKNKCNC